MPEAASPVCLIVSFSNLTDIVIDQAMALIRDVIVVLEQETGTFIVGGRGKGKQRREPRLCGTSVAQAALVRYSCIVNRRRRDIRICGICLATTQVTKRMKYIFLFCGTDTQGGGEIGSSSLLVAGLGCR